MEAFVLSVVRTRTFGIFSIVALSASMEGNIALPEEPQNLCVFLLANTSQGILPQEQKRDADKSPMSSILAFLQPEQEARV